MQPAEDSPGHGSRALQRVKASLWGAVWLAAPMWLMAPELARADLLLPPVVLPDAIPVAVRIEGLTAGSLVIADPPVEGRLQSHIELKASEPLEPQGVLPASLNPPQAPRVEWLAPSAETAWSQARAAWQAELSPDDPLAALTARGPAPEGGVPCVDGAGAPVVLDFRQRTGGLGEDRVVEVWRLQQADPAGCVMTRLGAEDWSGGRRLGIGLGGEAAPAQESAAPPPVSMELPPEEAAEATAAAEEPGFDWGTAGGVVAVIIAIVAGFTLKSGPRRVRRH